MKQFITCVPLQPRDALNLCQYEAVDNQKLVYGPTRFPIVPVLNGYTRPGESVRVVALISDYQNARDNAQTLQQEVAALCEKKGLDCPGVEPILMPYDDKLSTHLDAFQQLIGHIEDGDQLYACMTYGSKLSPVVELMALRYARRLCRNVEIGCVVYGKMDHRAGRGWLYDTTALVLLDDVMNALSGAGVRDPRAALRAMMEL